MTNDEIFRYFTTTFETQAEKNEKLNKDLIQEFKEIVKYLGSIEKLMQQQYTEHQYLIKANTKDIEALNGLMKETKETVNNHTQIINKATVYSKIGNVFLGIVGSCIFQLFLLYLSKGTK